VAAVSLPISNKARLTVLGCVLAAMLIVTPAAASAADRFASTTGSGSTCDQVTPCDIETAVNGANDGDDIAVLPGTYTTTVTLGITFGPFDPKFNVTIHGSPGARPVVNFSGSSSTAFYIATGSTLRDVDVNSTGTTASAFGAVEGGVVERVRAHASGADSVACNLTGESAIRDSVCWYSGPGGTDSTALSVTARYVGFDETDTARNVTAIATAGYGIRVRSASSTDSGITLAATNVIARGGGGAGGEDVRTERLTGTPNTPPQKMILDHSNYTTESEQDTGDISDPGTGTNVTTAPAFVDASTGDFHQMASSTGTLDLGTATGVLSGELDLDGGSRIRGTAPDIGADELPVVPPPPVLTGTSPASGADDNSPAVIGSAEPLSTVTLYPNGTCAGTAAGSELAEVFASPGISVAVPDNSTTTFSASATNEIGTSLCSSANATYTEVTPPAAQGPAPTPTPTPSASAAPSITKKKCKKKQHRAATSKKCKKKKKRK
jgi:hypothetical protein